MKPSVLQRLLHWYKPHAWGLVLAGVLLGLGALAQGGLVFLIETVLDDVLIEGNDSLLSWIPIAVGGLYLLKGFSRFGSGFLVHRAGLSVVRKIRYALFAKLLELELDWHLQTNRDVQVSRLVQDVARTESLVHALSAGLEKPLTLLALLGAALYMDVQLTLAALVVLPFVAWAIHSFSTRLRRTFQQTLDNLGNLTASAGQSLQGLEVVQTHRGESARQADFDAENQRQEQLQVRSHVARLLPGPVIEVLAAIGVGLVIWFGGGRVLSGELQPGELMAFLVAIGLMHMPLKGLSEMASNMQESLAGASRVFEVLDRNPEISGGTELLSTSCCEVEFDNVTVDYGDHRVLTGLDLRLVPGELVALVGASGSGKSTLVSLLSRIRDPTGGTIRINGVDLRSFTLDSLRRHVAVVSQHPILFDGTLRENLRLGAPMAGDEDLAEACRRAGLDELVDRLPGGFDTQLVAAGAQFSGGERQRLCIARALLIDAPILVLDEATSSIEPRAEGLLHSALEPVFRARTTLAIAHRLSTVQAADRIVVLENGAIVGGGRHEDLLLENPAYRRFLGAVGEARS